MLKLIIGCVMLIGLPLGAVHPDLLKSTAPARKITKQQVILCAPANDKSHSRRSFEDDAPAPDVMKITTPSVVEGYVGDFIEVEVETNCKKANFFGMDRGLATFPNRQRALPKATVVTAQRPGDYRIATYTARGDEPSDPVIFTIRVKKHPDDVDPVPVPPVPVPPVPVPPVPVPPVPVPPVPVPPVPVPPVPVPPVPVPPDPIPVPPEPKPPVIPAGTYGLGQVTYDAVMNGIPEDKRAPAKKISDDYAVVVAQIAAGTLKTVKDADAMLKTGNRAAVPVADVPLWSPVFSLIAGKINGLKLKTLDQWQQAFMEIGQGFAAVQ